MLPRSKPLLVFLVVLPVVLVAWMWVLAQKRPRLVATLSASATSLAFSHQGKTLAIGSSDGKLVLWKVAGQEKAQPLSIEGKSLRSSDVPFMELHFSSDDGALLASNVPLPNHDAIYSWDTQTRKVRWSAVSDVKSDPSRYCVSADGKVAAQLFYGVIKVLDTSQQGAAQNSKVSKFARSFPVISRIKLDPKERSNSNVIPQVIALSPDGKTVVGAFLDGHLKFWNATTGQKQSQTPHPSAGMYGSPSSGNWRLQYSPDGRYIALFDGNFISLWDTQGNAWQTTNAAGLGTDASISWAPDSHSLWTGSGTVQQWSVPELKSRREIPVSGPVAMASDGHTLATRNISSDGANGVWLWNIDS